MFSKVVCCPQRRPQAVERLIQRLVRRLPLRVEIVDRQEPPGTVGVDQLPVVAAEADRKVNDRGDLDVPLATGGCGEFVLRQVRWRKHPAVPPSPPMAQDTYDVTRSTIINVASDRVYARAATRAADASRKGSFPDRGTCHAPSARLPLNMAMPDGENDQS